MNIIILFCAGILLAYGILGYRSMYKFRLTTPENRPSPWPQDGRIYSAPRAYMDVSSARYVDIHGIAHRNNTIGFHVLRVSMVTVESGRWQLRIRAVLVNNTASEVVFDDLHAIVYTRLVPTPPLLTISYHGNAILLQDNTLFKEEKSYSIRPGDGIEIDVLTQVTRYEGAPSYYQMREAAGPVCILFGLISDFYATANASMSRFAVTSDSIFIFMCRSKEDVPQFSQVTRDNANSLYWPPKGYETLDPLLSTLEKHLEYRPELR